MKRYKVKDSRWDNLSCEVEDLILNKRVNGVILAGGVFRSWIHKDEPIADYDLFFTRHGAIQETEQFLVGKGYKVVFRCPLGELTTLKLDGVKVQLITKFIYEDVFHLVHSFDLTACCAGYDADTNSLVCNDNWLKDVRKKTIAFNQIQYPVATINRVFKYKQKGYNYTPESLRDFIWIIKDTEYDESSMVYYVD